MKKFLIAGILVIAAAALLGAQDNPKQKDNILKDKDGNIYSSKIMLDGKRWLTRNLRIKLTGSYCYDDKESNCGKYGRLYTWEAAKEACNALGDGWRLPTNDAWLEMARCYGGVHDESGNSGKSAYQTLLEDGSAGFNALLGGGRDPGGKYARLDAHGFYWSATERSSAEAEFFNFGKGSQALHRQSEGEKPRAFSVRCIRP